MTSPRSGMQSMPLMLGFAALAFLAWYGLGPGGWFRAAETEALAGVPVRRAALSVSVVERGNLKAADSVSLKSEIEGTTSILWLVDEGTHAEEGQLLIELDVTDLVDRRFSREISVRNAEANYVKSKQAYEIQKSQNTSDIAKSVQNLTFAGEDLRKFLEGERESRLAEGEESITLSTEEYARAENNLKWSQELEGKGFLTSTELEADRLAKNRAQIMLEQARRDLDLLTRFQLPRDEAALRADLEEAERELDRVRLQAKARIVDFEAAMSTNEVKLQLESDKLQQIEDQIAKAKIYAPRSGMVVYGKEPGSRYGSGDPIQAGTQVRERQELITIPSAKGMIAQASLHESVLKQVQAGQECIVRVDAVPGREFRGRVAFVALLPDQNSWWANPNQRLYRTDISIDEGSEEMRPGMSCSVEVLVDHIEDTLQVPVQSIFRHEHKNIAFVNEAGRSEARDVEVGRYNDRWVEVLAGLEEGEIVLLSPPIGFTPKPGGEDPDGAPRARKAPAGDGVHKPGGSSRKPGGKSGAKAGGKHGASSAGADEGRPSAESAATSHGTGDATSTAEHVNHATDEDAGKDAGTPAADVTAGSESGS